MQAFLRRHSTLLVMAAIGVAAAAAVRFGQGRAAFNVAGGHAVELLAQILPSLLFGLLLAGSLKQLMPANALAKWMGAESGWRGLVIASAAGILMPGGPMAAFPLVLVFAGAGADKGAVIAFIVSWGLNGMNRILVWEVPLLGLDFALLRFLSGLPTGVIAGWLARRIPLDWTPPEGALERVRQRRGA